VLGNCPENGEKIIARLGPEHQATGAPIIYTSADSVFQIAVHTDVVPLEELYRWCEAAREICDGEHAVGRIIARPFEGEPGAYHRRAERRDWALPPPRPTVCERLDDAGVEVIGIGKTADIFARVGVTTELHPAGLEAGCAATADVLANHEGPAFILTNLVDFDTLYGHVRDPHGYARALEQLDSWCARLSTLLRPGDVILISADHGNDPTFVATNDHTRELVPLVAFGPGITGADLGTRAMADVGPTICDLFGIYHPGMDGTSFADHLGAS
jgi:phosphopentomutase